MKLEKLNAANLKHGRYFMELGYRLEVSMAPGDEILSKGEADAFGDGNRIVAVAVDHIRSDVRRIIDEAKEVR